MSSWLQKNQAFNAAACMQAASVVTEFGVLAAYQEARRRREALPPGEAKVFAYNVELLTAEAVGISLDRPSASPLGPEAPFWILPFLTRSILSRVADAATKVLGKLRVPVAPNPASLLGAYVGAKPQTLSLLTPRQTECVRWAADGKSSTDIAAILGISAHTVDEHLDNACQRLGVRRRSQAIAKAAQAGILDTPRN